MKYTVKKTLAFLLTLVMLVNIFPLSAFAGGNTETGGYNPPLVKNSGTGNEEVTVKLNNTASSFHPEDSGLILVAFDENGTPQWQAPFPSIVNDVFRFAIITNNPTEWYKKTSCTSFLIVEPATTGNSIINIRGQNKASIDTAFNVINNGDSYKGTYFYWNESADENGIITINVSDTAPQAQTRTVAEGSNVIVTVDAAGIDLSNDGSRYYLVVGSNDSIAPYQATELTASSPAGSYGFTVDRLAEVDTLFVLIKRYRADETPNPTGSNDHEIVYNLTPTSIISVGDDDYDFAWAKEEGAYNYTITITKENNQSGGDEPTAEGHTAVIKLGKGVNLNQAYVVFFEAQSGKKGYVAIPLENAVAGSTHTYSSGTVFTEPWDGNSPYSFTSGDSIDVWIVCNADQGIQDHHAKQHGIDINYSPTIKSENANTYSYDGKTVHVTSDQTNNITTIQIGDMPAYDAEITFTVNGSQITPSLNERYYILAGIDEGGFDFFAPVNADGNVGSFTGEGLTADGKLPCIQSLQIVEYTGNVQNPTLMDLIGAESNWIANGGDLGGYTVTYPDSLEPDNNRLTFTAEGPVRYASTITFLEADGTQQASSAELNGNKYIVALDNGEPVYYAAVPTWPNPSDLVFKDSNGKIRNITADLTFEIKNVNNGNASFDEVIASDTSATLGKYILTSEYNENGTCAFTAKKNEEKAVNVVYYKNGGTETDPNPEVTGDFYMVVSLNDTPLYYAKVNTTGANHSFSNGVETFNGIPAGATVKLVEYVGTDSNPTLEELNSLPEAAKLSKYEWRRDESVTDHYVFNAVASNDLYVRVSTYEADNTTPLVPEEPITGQYYVRVPLRKAPVTDENKDDPPQLVGYCLAPFTFDSSASYKDVKLTKFVAPDKNAFDDDTAAPPLNISASYLDYYNVRVLKLLNDSNKPSTYEEATDKVNYVDDNPPAGWAFGGKENTDDGCNIHLKRADKTPRYHVRLKFDTTDLSEINLDGGAWLKVTVDHDTGSDTYGFIKLSNAEHKKAKYITVDEENGCIYIDIPITEWKNENGEIIPSERYTGNETGIDVKLCYGGDNATPQRAGTISEHEYINTSEIAAYPTSTEGVDHLRVESDNYIDVYDVVTLHQNDNKFTGYTLEEILNGYNIVTLCPNKVASPSNSDASAFGDGDFLMEKHQMGGVLIRGDVILVGGSGLADSADIRKPSVVGGYVPQFVNPFFNNRQNNDYGWNSYIGSVNTVVGDYYVNGQTVQGRGYTGTNTGVTVVDDNYVDWDRLQNMVISTSNSLGAAASDSVVSYDARNNVYTVPAGSNALINYPEKTVITIDIEVKDENGNLVVFEDLTGQGANNTTVTYKDYSGIPGTVVTNLGTGTYYPPLVKINGVLLNATVEDGSGMSLLWNYPNAKEVYIPGSVTPQFGHIVAPKAFINAPEDGNNSGCLVGNKVRSKLEGHLYPYKGATLIGFYGDLGFAKTVNGAKPTERQKYNFTLEKLTPHLTNSEYTERLSKLTGEKKEQRVFWQRLQTAQNEDDGNNTAADVINFEDISFDSAGTYYFRVYETPEIITNTTLDSHQYLIEIKVGSYAVNSSKSELRVSSIKYYDIDTTKDLLNITASTNGKNASLNLGAIGATHSLTWNQDEQECNTGITFDNTVTAAGYYVTLEGTKHLEGRNLRDREFHFTVTDITDSNNPVQVATGTNIADGTASNEIHFTQIAYKAEDFTSEVEGPVTKTFTYQITEDRPQQATSENNYTWENITYDPNVITATVTVTYNPDANVNNGESFFTHTTTYSPETDTFNNKYTATIETDLKATKSITGQRNKFKAGDTWTFKVTATETSATPGNTAIPMPPTTEIVIAPDTGDEIAEIDFGKITFTKADVGRTYVYTISEEGNVPGIKNDEAKTVKITVSENTDGTLSITRTPSSQIIPFVNFDKGSTDIRVEKLWVNSNNEPISHTSGSATVQLIAVRSEVEHQSTQPTKANLDVNVSWANNSIPSDAMITVALGGTERTLTLNNANSYRGTFEDLTIGETYTLTATVTAGDGTTLTTTTVTTEPIIDGQNTATFNASYTRPDNTKDLTVSIAWSGNNAPGDGVNITAKGTDNQTIILNSGNNWSGTFSGLDIGSSYQVQLTIPDNSGISINENPLTKEQIEDNDNNTLTFNGTFTSAQPTTQDLNLTINWDNTPSDVSVQVTATNTSDNTTKTVTLTSNGTSTWTGTIQGLAADQNYSVAATISGNNAGNASIGNTPQTIQLTSSNHQVSFSGTYTQQQPETADLQVSISWDNTPSDVNMNLTAVNTADSSDTHQVTLSSNGSNNWGGTISGLSVGATYSVSMTGKGGNNANNANLTDAPKNVTIASGTNNVAFAGQYTGGQSSGTGTIPVTINWDNAPSDVTVTVTATNQNNASDVVSIDVTGTGTQWTGTITGLSTDTNYIISYSAHGARAHGVTSLSMSNNYVYVNNNNNSAAITGTYTSVEPVPEGKVILTIYKQSNGNNREAIVNAALYNAGTLYVTMTIAGNGAPADYSATNGDSGSVTPQSSQHSDTIPFTFESGVHTITIDCNWGAGNIIDATVSETNPSGYNTNIVRYIASTGWSDVSFGTTAPMINIDSDLMSLDKLQEKGILPTLTEGNYELVGAPVTLQYNATKPDESWKHVWEDLPQYYQYIDPVTHEVTEYNLTYYVIETSATNAVSNAYSPLNTETNTYTITNTYSATGTTQIQATKAISGHDWPDNGSIVFTLTGTGRAARRCPQKQTGRRH